LNHRKHRLMAASSNPASSTYNLPKLQSRSLSINMNFCHHNKRLSQAKTPSHRQNITTTNAFYRQKRLLTGKTSPQQMPFTGKNAFHRQNITTTNAFYRQKRLSQAKTPITGKNAFHRQKRLSQAKKASPCGEPAMLQTFQQ
jgi:uridine phosphorylase